MDERCVRPRRPRVQGCALVLGVASLAACANETGANRSALTRNLVDVVVPEGLDLSEDLTRDLAALEEEMSTMRARLDLPDTDENRVVITVRGRGEVEEQPEDLMPGGEVSREDVTTDEHLDDPDYASWVTVHLQTGSEFEVRFPRNVLEAAEARGRESRLHLGSERIPESVEGREEDRARIDVDIDKGLSNGIDTRQLKGTYNSPQTHNTFEKLVSLGTYGGCSGTLVGPKHIVTAAHCIRNFQSKTWRSGTAYAGRSGYSAYRASAQYNANPSIASTWYWLPAAFLYLADGKSKMPYSATPFDIGVLVTHTSRMGNKVGWMGWYWWSNDATLGSKTRYNRGYPGCSQSNSPSPCLSLGLYGDSANCASTSYSSPDADGINRRFRFHCDVSPGHSGSSLYHYLNGNTLVVTGIVSWQHCSTCGPLDFFPNTGVRITKEYSGAIHWLRQTFP